ncbi:UDP-N-acetylglucosamine--N-acetylmuramyl-(pentapeptide) pyrophosphoryl-undecaprenol N-acetylglucosamine transferase [Candidatus Nardonella dryophthoridicola]|uniref:UDP-N-acetylglucosamine--N-acetylmuramyl-(Pentapeptide) pyrophosphoryl-undecaprenol N-acetylglucosamine transferase n=1 Tax=endosymbiont of Rhynchophorus ferrugineus TaxID=1972133 RepID=A0A2Z5TP11_9GAMM|nr:UDP-N-acetylglucosamine--N-acetylmuramyl-(pentapeptide) pyrophosphoryl-undecaprenol N-acetylglucosamine transferase [Candidatus Nardonella dryophthoridicola]BBA84979.1 UDP-N-acetylglucosamine--N-acetylmuramyl-(pentapeptide) pyrophosphoryl-undecaprenol N-acetylglucosamine transferase [endosymbiont of Rhynchophorus ferrugineus]
MINKNIIIITGGSLGHIIPGIIIGNLLIKKKYNIYWILNNKEEKIYIKKYNTNINVIIIKLFKKKKKNIFFILNFFVYIFFIISYILKCLYILFNIKPIFILCLGNMSIFLCILSWIINIPIIIHEQNSILGRSNYIVNFISKKTIKSIRYNYYYDNNFIIIKNPIREEFNNYKYNNKNYNSNILKILILGGSKGSKFINFNILKFISLIKNNNLLIWHQIGNEYIDVIINEYKKYNLLNSLYKIDNLIYNISYAYYWTDFVISRCGAMSISEIIYTKTPSILIPLETKDNHQYYNTFFLRKNNFSKVIVEKDLNFNSKLEYYIKLFSNKKYLLFINKEMKKKIKYNIKKINKKFLIELNNEFKY